MLGPKTKILLFPEMRVTKKIFTRAAGIFFLINLIKFFNKVYAQRTTLTALFFVNNKEFYLLLLEEKKTSIRPNKFASGKPP